MACGIDTFRTRLDLLLATTAAGIADDPTETLRTSQELDIFRQWNGGTVTLPDSAIVGGDPAFAGRNFLGGDFIWSHAENTDASINEPDGATYPLATGAPSPDQPQNLNLTVKLITPIQAPLARQQQTGQRGFIYGKIDAQAICNRLLACITYELFYPSTYVTYVWLAVDPAAGLSADYWAGWSDFINKKTDMSFGKPGIQPFRACILCSYTKGADALLHPDPHVVAALNSSYTGSDKRCFAFWADAYAGSGTAPLAPNPALDWSSFDPKFVPALWRLKNGCTLATGGNASPANIRFDVDAINPNASAAQTPTNFMLTANKWQPSASTILNPGFSNQDPVNTHTQCLQTTDLPTWGDNGYSTLSSNRGHFLVIGGQIKVIGRYVGQGTSSLSAAEAQDLSSANFRLFTTWEAINSTVSGGPFQPRNPADKDDEWAGNWGDFNHTTRKYIYYFDTQYHAGTEDGQNAFKFCAETLKQPSHTPVFFTIDFDPLDLQDPNNPGPQPTPASTHPSPSANWPQLPTAATRRQWIKNYFELLKAARDAYAAANPDRYYEIGVYCSGGALQWCYEQGIASSFWQAASFAHTGSKPPRWPWYHANRWQYQTDEGIKSAKNAPCGLTRMDPDADWGDGGTWTLTDPVEAQLDSLGSPLQNNWNGLTEPAQLPPANPP